VKNLHDCAKDKDYIGDAAAARRNGHCLPRTDPIPDVGPFKLGHNPGWNIVDAMGGKLLAETKDGWKRPIRHE